MFEDLEKLIVAIQRNYDRICDSWKENIGDSINLKKKLVIHAREESEILNIIVRYRSLINDEIVGIMFDLDTIQFVNSSITSRVKAQNSIEFKLENYIVNHEDGLIPLKKCLNDLLGVRIVIDDEFTQQEVKQYMDKHFPDYKCIDSSKIDYNATHVYFERGNNFFPWELQIWKKKDEKNNYISHKEYKQEYTKWEKENKGGVEDDKTFYDFE